jgi:hypothetical protein
VAWQIFAVKNKNFSRFIASLLRYPNSMARVGRNSMKLMSRCLFEISMQDLEKDTISQQFCLEKLIVGTEMPEKGVVGGHSLWVYRLRDPRQPYVSICDSKQGRISSLVSIKPSHYTR